MGVKVSLPVGLMIRLPFKAGAPVPYLRSGLKQNLHTKVGGVISQYRIIRGGWGTYDEITSKGASIRIRLLPDGSLFNNNLSGTYLNLSDFGSLTGRYALDSTEHSIIITRWDDQIVSGTIDAWFYDPDEPSRRIYFSDGWFDVSTRPF